MVAGHDIIEAYILVRAVSLDAARTFRGKIEKCADGAAGLFARLQFENLSQQNQHSDDGRRLEIDRHRAIMSAQRRRK